MNNIINSRLKVISLILLYGQDTLDEMLKIEKIVNLDKKKLKKIKKELPQIINIIKQLKGVE